MTIRHQLNSDDQGCRNEKGDDMSQTSRLARQVTLDEAWSSSPHSEICCLIYATQNGWKLPILFEEMGVPYDWALVDFETNEQRTERFLSCLLYTSPSPRDRTRSRMPSSA